MTTKFLNVSVRKNLKDAVEHFWVKQLQNINC